MEIDVEQLPVVDHPEHHAFEIHIGDKVALVAYRRGDGVITYIHTEVPPELGGHGVAARLAKYALDYARENGLSVIPQCPYVAAYVARHPEYRDLVRRPG